jgi:hypothetical protein
MAKMFYFRWILRALNAADNGRRAGAITAIVPAACAVASEHQDPAAARKIADCASAIRKAGSDCRNRTRMCLLASHALRTRSTRAAPAACALALRPIIR